MTDQQQSLVERTTDRVVVRKLGDESVVYDLATERVTALDSATGRVWEATSKPRNLAGLEAASGLDAQAVVLAVAKLEDAGLLKSAGLSRRTLLRGAGVAALTVPLVTVMAPAAYATSSRGKLTGTQTACTRKAGNAGSDVTLTVTATLFDPNTPLTVTVTYKNKNGTTTTTTSQTLTTDGSGGTTFIFTFNVATTSDSPSGAQTVTINATQGGTTFSFTATITSC